MRIETLYIKEQRQVNILKLKVCNAHKHHLAGLVYITEIHTHTHLPWISKQSYTNLASCRITKSSLFANNQLNCNLLFINEKFLDCF